MAVSITGDGLKTILKKFLKTEFYLRKHATDFFIFNLNNLVKKIRSKNKLLT